MTYELKIEEDENGDAILMLPDEITEKYNLQEGDEITYEIKDGVAILHFNDAEHK